MLTTEQALVFSVEALGNTMSSYNRQMMLALTPLTGIILQALFLFNSNDCNPYDQFGHRNVSLVPDTPMTCSNRFQQFLSSGRLYSSFRWLNTSISEEAGNRLPYKEEGMHFDYHAYNRMWLCLL